MRLLIVFLYVLTLPINVLLFTFGIIIKWLDYVNDWFLDKIVRLEKMTEENKNNNNDENNKK